MRTLTIILFLASFLSGKAQMHTLTGRIVSENLETLPEVKITNHNEETLGITDIDGIFKISIPDGGLKLNISFVGMEPTVIEISSNCDYLEVIMMASANYDFVSLKKVDRLRMKRFKKLPNLHKKAFEKGLFKTEEACYIQKFISNHKKK